MTSWPEFLNQLNPVIDARNYQQAKVMLETYLTQNPNDPSALITLGNLYRQAQFPDALQQSINYYYKVLNLKFDFLPVWISIVEVYLEHHHIEAALDALSQALCFDNRHPQLWSLYEKITSLLPIAPAPRSLDVVMYTGHPMIANNLPHPNCLAQAKMGGSESMFLLMGKALAALGLKVALYGNFAKPDANATPATFRLGDFYLHQHERPHPFCIVSRYEEPFKNELKAKRRVLWLHDIVANHYVEPYLVIQQQCDEFWYLSQYQLQFYLKLGVLDPKTFFQTTNAIIPETIPDNKNLQQRNKYTLYYISRPKRGLDVAIQCFDLLKKKYPDLTLNVCSYTQHKNLETDPELAPFIPAMQLRKDIHLKNLDKQSLYQALNTAHLLLYPNTSLLETSCLAVIESMACGLPVVTSDRGCLTETVPHEQAGLIVPYTEDSEKLCQSLTAACEKILDDDNYWQQLSQFARQYALQKHDVNHVAQEWIKRIKFL